MRVARAFLATVLVLALGATPASAQTLGELNGTTGLLDTLAGGSLPAITAPEVCSTTTLPDLDAEGNVIPRETTCTGGQTQTTGTTPAAGTDGSGTTAEQPPRGQANGYYCRDQSRKRVAGEKGTAFSRCVTAMSKIRSGSTPATACKGLSRKPIRGKSGTAHSRCLTGARRLQRDLAAG